jgi:tetrapyrrole methylase family protein/MazG family protein
VTGRVTVVGLGPAGDDLVTAAARAAIDAHPPGARFVRTTRHPAAGLLAGATSFDAVYESAATFDEVYGRIVDALVEAAHEHGEVVYAVPGSPAVAERTVELLRADGRVEVEVVPALSFADLAWVRLGVDPVALGVRMVDGRRFEVEAAGERGPLLVAQCDSREVLADIKAVVDDPPAVVWVLHHLGLPDEVVAEVPWADVDRAVDADHLTSLYLPAGAPPVAREVQRFVELVRTLRRECPWDREQTHASLTPHLVEESYELVEAIDALGVDADDAADAYEHLEEELGDLLFQIVFHTTLAAEQGAFALDDVARTIHDKLVRRHPHVFGTVDATTPDQVISNWEQIKRAEKQRASIFDGIPKSLPALLYAVEALRKSRSVGQMPLSEDRSTYRTEGETVGTRLFALVAEAVAEGEDPEGALRAVVNDYVARARAAEASNRPN